jgi:hypothetical protein
MFWSYWVLLGSSQFAPDWDLLGGEDDAPALRFILTATEGTESKP